MRDPIQNLKLRLEEAREAQPKLTAAWREALASHSDAELAAAVGCEKGRVSFIRETQQAMDKAGFKP